MIFRNGTSSSFRSGRVWNDLYKRCLGPGKGKGSTRLNLNVRSTKVFSSKVLSGRREEKPILQETIFFVSYYPLTWGGGRVTTSIPVRKSMSREERKC